MATVLIYKEGLKLTLFGWTKSYSHIPIPLMSEVTAIKYYN